MKALAPVVLFIYNRPSHTRETLTALMANKYADQTELFIFADGPKQFATDEENKRIAETRAVANEQQWCGEIKIIERSKNVGLAVNITDGVSSIVNKYGKIIVLEDDIVTAPSFLTYMNYCLDLYGNDNHVMHIAGYTFPWIDASKVGADTYFYRVPSCWGWATWARSWKHYSDSTEELFVRLCETGKLRSFDLEYSGAFIGQLNANLLGHMRSWAVKWYASVMLANGLSLHPSVSLVNNTGFDGTGMNSADSNLFKHVSLGALENPNREQVLESKYVSGSMIRRYRNPWMVRIKIFFANRVKNYLKLKFFSKGK